MEIPVTVETVINEYINLLKAYFPGILEGVYIHGSIALNAYVEDSSDIDFITIINRRLSEEDFNSLTSIHAIIADKYKKPEMDGVYALYEDIGKLYLNSYDNEIQYAYFNSGQLMVGDYFNFNPITWWVFKEKGINIIGPEPKDFQMNISSQQLLAYVLGNMNSYWANLIQSMENSIIDYINLSIDQVDMEIEWTVLGLLRQYYTLKEKDIISKMDAGKYGLLNLPEEWHAIIKEAMDIRSGIKSTLFHSDEERIHSTIAFSKYIIEHCNESLFPYEYRS